MFFVGAVLLIVGMGMFQLGAEMAMSPLGEGIGVEMSKSRKVGLMAVVGFVMGVLITIAEPDLQILSEQVPSIPNRVLILTVAVGIGIFLAIAVLRILTGIPIQWIIIPGYLIALVLSRFVPKIFVGIAFDSGGVSSGPMTSTFLLPLCIGACEALGGNIMTDAFGVVALVALTPLIAIQLMGVQYKCRMRKQQMITKPDDMLPEDIDAIVEIEEE